MISRKSFFVQNGLVLALLAGSTVAHLLLLLFWGGWAARLDAKSFDRQRGRTVVSVRSVTPPPSRPPQTAAPPSLDAQPVRRTTESSAPVVHALARPDAPRQVRIETASNPPVARNRAEPVERTDPADPQPTRRRPSTQMVRHAQEVELPRAATAAAASGVQVRPTPVYNPDPAYPPDLWAQGIQGSVMLRFVIGTDGRAHSIEVEKSSGHAAFDRSAIDTVSRSWRFTPASRDGKPVAQAVRKSVSFTIRPQ
jgi:periplasmic protein TonB